MNRVYKVLSYTPEDKMSDLICDNYPMLHVLTRFSIDLGFKDQTIEETCIANGVDVTTFLAVVNLLIAENRVGINYKAISLGALIDYLSNSHKYFTEFKLPKIRKRLQEAIQDNDSLSMAVINYYDEYIAEVNRHMRYEEGIVFKYVDDLLKGQSTVGFNIGMFSDHHESMDSKLTELKNIIIKYYPSPSTNELSSVLFEIFACESDLLSHSEIEDYLLIPAIRHLEESKE